MDTAKLTQLCERLAEIDLFGTAPPAPPWGKKSPTPNQVVAAVQSGANTLPLTYRTGYVQPLLATVPALIARNQGQVEPFIAPIYEHASTSKVKPQLQRFLAVISNLYRSFLDDTKRSKIDVPLIEQLPPLAFFQNAGDSGPYTIPASDLSRDIETDIGIVSLPSTYRDHPVLWSSLAHETGGHDVVHADAGLIDELQQGVMKLFGATKKTSGEVSPKQMLGLLWTWWMDEAVADVYGLLNIGPQFALNLTAFFSAMNAVAAKMLHQPVPDLPSLRTTSGPRDPNNNDFLIDEHPTDILRLDLAIGVIGALTGLSAARKNRYIADLRQAATASAAGAKVILLDGILPVGRHTGVPLKRVTMPLADAQAAARQVGEFIATAKFKALLGHSIQEIETWDDLDENSATQISNKLLQSQPIANLGDDAQLLAGANQALLQNPNIYDEVTGALNAGLDVSFAHDPIWSAPIPDSMIVPARMPRMRIRRGIPGRMAENAFRPSAVRRKRGVRPVAVPGESI